MAGKSGAETAFVPITGNRKVQCRVCVVSEIDKESLSLPISGCIYIYTNNCDRLFEVYAIAISTDYFRPLGVRSQDYAQLFNSI